MGRFQMAHVQLGIPKTLCCLIPASETGWFCPEEPFLKSAVRAPERTELALEFAL